MMRNGDDTPKGDGGLTDTTPNNSNNNNNNKRNMAALSATARTECPNCGKVVPCSRFTLHLDKCLVHPATRRSKQSRF